MAEYARISVNTSNSARMVFALHIPIVISCLRNCVVTCFNVYTKVDVIA